MTSANNIVRVLAPYRDPGGEPRGSRDMDAFNRMRPCVKCGAPPHMVGFKFVRGFWREYIARHCDDCGADYRERCLDSEVR